VEQHPRRRWLRSCCRYRVPPITIDDRRERPLIAATDKAEQPCIRLGVEQQVRKPGAHDKEDAADTGNLPGSHPLAARRRAKPRGNDRVRTVEEIHRRGPTGNQDRCCCCSLRDREAGPSVLDIARSNNGEIWAQNCGGLAPTITAVPRVPDTRQASSM
jgi:hypothetical protein